MITLDNNDIQDDCLLKTMKPYRTRLRPLDHGRVLENFAGFLGLAEVEEVRPQGSRSEYRVRGTRLLKETLTFRV
ncbi:MAG: hypothetical protein BMS9Abin05_1008 [Rhodothermia bacterium]|nr:MAG: hypothetical protein BMS9Abin05_1008 [Rhodothermia bacterium]